jgi:hypothetical protein
VAITVVGWTDILALTYLAPLAASACLPAACFFLVGGVGATIVVSSGTVGVTTTELAPTDDMAALSLVYHATGGGRKRDESGLMTRGVEWDSAS